MPQLKTKEPKPNFDRRPSCYVDDPALLGFTFEVGKSEEIFLLHSFLSRIELKSENEILFHYTYGIVRVTGSHLEHLYRMVKQHVIGGIRPSALDDPCRAEMEVRQIVFEDAKIIE
ncbi:MAG: hypothetical protein LV480_00485 [Methylacidiphilales bacterium]|nr:hypothetical protein [Candidatus Methylacidiphilales bacterium]